MSSMLINDPKYSWLKDLDLGPTNKGVFYGVWDGTGEVYCFVEVEYTGIPNMAFVQFVLTAANNWPFYYFNYHYQ